MRFPSSTNESIRCVESALSFSEFSIAANAIQREDPRASMTMRSTLFFEDCAPVVSNGASVHEGLFSGFKVKDAALRIAPYND